MVAHRMSRPGQSIGFIVAVFALLNGGCKTNDIVDSQILLITPFSGISRSDIMGHILEPDSNDWKPLNGIGMEFLPKGAYPNPCDAQIGFDLGWRILSADSIFVTINDWPEHALHTLFAGRLVPGQHVIMAHVDGLLPSVYRVYFHVVRHDSTFTTYGDVQVAN